MINQREIDQFDLFTLRQNLGKLSYLKLSFDKSCHIFLLVLKNTGKGQKLQVPLLLFGWEKQISADIGLGQKLVHFVH